MDAVLEHRGALVGFSSVDVHDLHAVHLVEEPLVAQLHEHVGQAGRVAHADQRPDPGSAGGAVQVEDGPGGVEVVAHVDVVDPRSDRRLEHWSAEAVEGADAVDHQRGALQQRRQRGGRGDVDFGSGETWIGDVGDGAVGGDQVEVGHHHRGCVVRGSERGRGDTADSATSSEHHHAGRFAGAHDSGTESCWSIMSSITILMKSSATSFIPPTTPP